MKILCYPNKKLKSKCTDVKLFGPKLKQFTDSLALTMMQHEGDSLAATQVGVNKAIFVMKIDDESVVFVNPKILFFDGQEIETQEGCLSVPGIVANLKCRNDEICVEAVTPMGVKISMTLMGREAIIFQHELDHLEGKVIFDKMNRVQKMMKLKKYQTSAKKISRKLAEARKK